MQNLHKEKFLSIFICSSRYLFLQEMYSHHATKNNPWLSNEIIILPASNLFSK